VVRGNTRELRFAGFGRIERRRWQRRSGATRKWEEGEQLGRGETSARPRYGFSFGSAAEPLQLHAELGYRAQPVNFFHAGRVISY
jgi:hypothetical protein